MSNGLSAAELSQIRSDINSLLPDTCHIMGITNTSDGAGGWTPTAGTVTANVPCRMDFVNPGKEQLSGGVNIPFKQGIISMAYDVTVTTAHQILFSGITYNVIGENSGQSWIGGKQVIVERVP